MSSDSENESTPVEETPKKKKRCKKKKGGDCDGKVMRYGKFAGIMFFIYVVIMSDIFVSRVLAQMSPTFAEGNTPSRTGIFVQGFMLVVLMVVVSELVDSDKI